MISVIIPTYNRQLCLARAITSVQQQSLVPMEIIVVDDASTDGTSAWVEQAYPSVKLITLSENRGVSYARNQGIQQAQGDWIALLDSDDEWLPQRLQQQQQALQQQSDYFICHTNETWVRNGRRVNPMKKHQKYGGWIFQRCLPLCAISPSSVLIHRKIFAEIGYFDEAFPVCEDYDLWLRICRCYPVLYLDSPLIVKYGGHQDQLSRALWGMDRFRIQAITKQLQQPGLSTEDYHAALTMLHKKINIYLKGLYKRQRVDDIAYYKHLQQRYPLTTEYCGSPAV